MNADIGILMICGVIFGVIGLLIGKRKRRPLGGFVLGLLLGPLGWLLVFFGPTAKDKNIKHCPYCRSIVRPKIRICGHCENIMNWVGNEPQRKITMKTSR